MLVYKFIKFYVLYFLVRSQLLDISVACIATMSYSRHITSLERVQRRARKYILNDYSATLMKIVIKIIMLILMWLIF